MSDSGVHQTILVVEHSSAIRAVIGLILQLAGYRTVDARSAKQAQELIVQQLPDLIFVDLGLPGIDGLKFARMLRASPLTAQVSLVAAMAQVSADDEIAAIAAGFDALVSKPIQRRELRPGSRLPG